MGGLPLGQLRMGDLQLLLQSRVLRGQRVELLAQLGCFRAQLLVRHR